MEEGPCPRRDRKDPADVVVATVPAVVVAQLHKHRLRMDYPPPRNRHWRSAHAIVVGRELGQGVLARA